MTTLPWGRKDSRPANGRRRGDKKPGGVRDVLAEATSSSSMSEREVVVSSGLVVLSVIMLWLVVQMLVLGGLEFSRGQDRLYGQLRAELATGEAPTGGVIAPGDPVALLKLPSLGVDQVVVEGTSAGHMLTAPGHRRDTVLPGQAGVSVLYGRSQTFGKPFQVMLQDALGKDMNVVTGQGTSTYRIEQVRRPGDPVPAPPAAGQGRLTLVTSQGSGFLSALRPGEVVYVDASLRTKSFAGGAARVNTIAKSERPMAGDHSVLPMLALTLGGLLAAVVATPFARRRFGSVLTWMIAAPVVLALAWFAADLTVYLLPNLL
ncbi:hypothetical protein ASD11_07155 [Aeromicrobium sp. Root495]|uniref:sortase domain-containing protein n=1 Tax=Aeromicrobium sp. Root495 TaxID=1736550 RepID=UPI0006F6E34E|nr:sortase [Aeromicrobium sp. Root495]KQY59340.1 hypothetical protein ASD11_07155 [Aeromicrobium sp. Root495]